MSIPGFGTEEHTYKKSTATEAHKQVNAHNSTVAASTKCPIYSLFSIIAACQSDQEVKEIVEHNSLSHTHTPPHAHSIHVVYKQLLQIIYDLYKYTFKENGKSLHNATILTVGLMT